MGTLSSDRKAEIGKELRVASTWVEGPRSAKLLALAHEIEGADPDEAATKATEELAARAVQGGPSVGGLDTDFEVRVEERKARAKSEK